MSTSTSYDLSMAEADRDAMERELTRRRMEQLRLEAMDCQAEVAKLATRLTALDLESPSAQIAQLRRELLAQQGSLAVIGKRLQEQHADVCGQTARLERLNQSSGREMDQLARSIEQGRGTLRSIDRVAALNLERADELADAATQGAEMMRNQTDIASRLSQLGREIEFITCRSSLAPAAMATLLCMEENGYILNQTLGSQGLTSYFRNAAHKHQIAVRIAPVQDRPSRWELLAETFEVQGPQCLAEMDEFEAAFEDLEIGQLARGKFRIYPKDDSGLAPERRGRLAKPEARREDAPKSAKRDVERQ